MKPAEILFNKFSLNLQNISFYLGFELEEKYQKEGYICPLSFKIFSKEGLSTNWADQLTIEHVPPESLSGKALCLTNRISNSKSGHTLDISVLNHIKIRESNEGISGLKTKVFIEGVKMDGYLDFMNKEKPQFNFSYYKRHQGITRVENKMLTDKTINLKFTIPVDNRDTLISFLRIAYLYAFGHLGYSLIFGVSKLVNPNFDLIRRQINNPEKFLIDDIILINKDLENFQAGLYIVYEPIECRSLFVVFDIVTVNKKWRYGLFLPGPDDFGFKALNNIKLLLNNKKKIDFVYHNIPDIDLTDPIDCMYYVRYWSHKVGFFND